MRIARFPPSPGSALAMPAPSGLAVRVAALLQAWSHWQAERRTVAELDRLDKATLRDIGVRAPISAPA